MTNDLPWVLPRTPLPHAAAATHALFRATRVPTPLAPIPPPYRPLALCPVPPTTPSPMTAALLRAALLSPSSRRLLLLLSPPPLSSSSLLLHLWPSLLLLCAVTMLWDR